MREVNLSDALVQYVATSDGDQDDNAKAFEAGWRACAGERAESASQPRLFGGDSGPAWTPHSGTGATRETSLAAAASVSKGRAKGIRKRVLAALAVRPDTDAGLAKRLECPDNSVRPRRIELWRDGKIRAVGTQSRPSGRTAMVWGVVD